MGEPLITLGLYNPPFLSPFPRLMVNRPATTIAPTRPLSDSEASKIGRRFGNTYAKSWEFLPNVLRRF